MPYYEVQSFSAGMDVRKAASTAPAGTMRMLKNAFINPGGEIEKRQAFVDYAPAPADTTGLIAFGSNLYAVRAGGTTSHPVGAQIGVLALLGLPGGVTVAALLDSEIYAGKVYTVVRGSDGVEYHHYDGALIAGVKGATTRTYKTKMYRGDGQYLRFSAVGNPVDQVGTGAGFIDLSAEDHEMLQIQALEVYYDKMAVFSRRAVQLWTLDPDPSKNSLQQTLRQAGTTAPRSVRQYGSGDILYLSQDGIRSLKAREQSLTASVSDIGSPVDGYVKEMYLANTNDMLAAISLLEPANGRYWLITRTKILVLSSYPNPKISAWCVFTPTHDVAGVSTPFDVVYAAATPDFMFLRAADHMVYRFGAGAASPVYDTTEAEVVLPYLDFEKAASFKEFKAIDAAAENDWQVYVGLNPGNETAEDYMGVINGPTFLEGQFPLMGHSTHISLRFRTTSAKRCMLNSLMIHYDETITT